MIVSTEQLFSIKNPSFFTEFDESKNNANNNKNNQSGSRWLPFGRFPAVFPVIVVVGVLQLVIDWGVVGHVAFGVVGSRAEVEGANRPRRRTEVNRQPLRRTTQTVPKHLRFDVKGRRLSGRHSEREGG